MNKYNIGFSIKLPITGQQFSNLETRIDWGEETEMPFEDALPRMIGQAKKAREAIDGDSSKWQTELITSYEEKDRKLDKARESYISLRNEK